MSQVGMQMQTQMQTRRIGIPSVEEKDGRRFDLFSRLLKERVVMLSGAIDDASAAVVVGSLLFLEAESVSDPIHLYINSSGGVVTSGLSIVDTMQYVAAPVHTVCVGQASSMGSLILAAGEEGHRAALPHSRIMIHQPHASGLGGQESDIRIQADNIQDMRSTLTALYAQFTGQDLDEIHARMERDTFFNPSQALDFGLIDHILHSRDP